MSDELSLDLDLDAARKVRAAEREGKKRDMPIRLGGKEIAVLPVELPVDVLAPLRNLDGDLTLLLREAMAATKAGGDGQQARWNATELVVDLLATNPRLPVTSLDTFKDIAVNLLGDEGFDALLSNRPSPQDYAFLIMGVFRFYGVTLGEASPSSDSSTDSGGTLSGTSSTTSDSMPEPSGTTPETTTSSVPVGS